MSPVDDRVAASTEAVKGLLACIEALADISGDDLCERVALLPGLHDTVETIGARLTGERRG